MIRCSLLAIVVVLAGCQSGPNSDSSADAAKGPTVTSVSFHKPEGGKPGQQADRFDYRWRDLFFVAQVDPPLNGSTVRWLFQTVDTTGGKERPVARVEEKASGGRLAAKISLATDWPVGTYQGVIVIDESPVKTFEFEIGGQRTKIFFRSHAVAPDDGAGNPQKRDVPVTTNDKTIHVAVFTVGIDTEGLRVVWNLRKKGQAKDLATADLGVVKFQNSVVSAQFRSPSGWEAGDYTATVSLDGAPAHAIDFAVK